MSHVVPVPRATGVPDQLSALCGAVLRRGETEWLSTLRGMPCERCLTVASRQAAAEVLRPAG